mgnify:CR=1 FL=1
MSHANAALTARARLTVGQLVIDQHVPIAEVAARFGVLVAHGQAVGRAVRGWGADE